MDQLAYTFRTYVRHNLKQFSSRAKKVLESMMCRKIFWKASASDSKEYKIFASYYWLQNILLLNRRIAGRLLNSEVE